MSKEFAERFGRLGFAVINEAISPEAVQELRREADRLFELSGSRGGARNLLPRSDRCRDEGESGATSRIAKQILGPKARPTKLTLFNKTPDANWLIRWHQDLAITVAERCEAPGFSSWSIKEGVHHVRPPARVLEGVLAIRLHLDDTPASNGALRVLPGSHRLGRLTRDAVHQLREESQEVICEVPQGGAMLMSPLLLHASSKAAAPKNRRVLHFEYAAAALPHGLQWA